MKKERKMLDKLTIDYIQNIFNENHISYSTIKIIEHMETKEIGIEVCLDTVSTKELYLVANDVIKQLLSTCSYIAREDHILFFNTADKFTVDTLLKFVALKKKYNEKYSDDYALQMLTKRFKKLQNQYSVSLLEDKELKTKEIQGKITELLSEDV